MKNIVDRIGLPALLEQTAEECAELAHACLKEARRLRGENPTPKTTPECWLAISEELTDLQICIEMLGCRISRRPGHSRRQAPADGAAP